jgi:TonB family protein
VQFSLQVIPQLLAKLSECTTDLRHFWNMTDAEQKNIAAPSTGDIRSIFSPSDYPDEAMRRDQEGSAQFLSLIDEKGRVADCDVLKPSGVPPLDGMGCQVIRERARFKPALDRQGKPMRSSFVTPPVVWKIAG